MPTNWIAHTIKFSFQYCHSQVPVCSSQAILLFTVSQLNNTETTLFMTSQHRNNHNILRKQIKRQLIFRLSQVLFDLADIDMVFIQMLSSVLHIFTNFLSYVCSYWATSCKSCGVFLFSRYGCLPISRYVLCISNRIGKRRLKTLLKLTQLNFEVR